MGIYTQKEKELLADDPEVRKRLLSFASMSGKEFFREVQSRLSPEELERISGRKSGRADLSYDPPPTNKTKNGLPLNDKPILFWFFFKIVLIIHLYRMTHPLHTVVEVIF